MNSGLICVVSAVLPLRVNALGKNLLGGSVDLSPRSGTGVGQHLPT